MEKQRGRPDNAETKRVSIMFVGRADGGDPEAIVPISYVSEVVVSEAVGRPSNSYRNRARGR